MKTPRLASLLSLSASALALVAGCQSPRATRIQEHAALFASLDPVTQKIVQDGLFDRGFTSELIYISLGKPSRRSTAETENGTVETWVYRNFVYANVRAVRLGVNNPGTIPSGPILSSSAPGGPSLMSTKSGPVQPGLSDGGDAPVGTLYLDFLNGRVVASRIEP